MRAVLQRVTRAGVTIGGARVAEIDGGLLILLGVMHADTERDADSLAEKIASLRIFADDAGKFNRSLLDVGGAALVVSQFTLMADARRGRRPSFVDAARPEHAAPLVDRFVTALSGLGVPTQTGEFGAHMLVDLVNDGPVTIILP